VVFTQELEGAKIPNIPTWNSIMRTSAENMELQIHKLERLTGIVISILVFILFCRTPVDADLWWHLRAGQVMWEQKTILLVDPFSYTKIGAPWVNAFWLSEILFYGLNRIGGYFALAVFVSLTGAYAFYIVYKRLLGNFFIKGSIILLAALTAAPIWGPRPQLFSFVLIAILDSWLSKAENRKPLAGWVLVPLFALWANLHGGWIWGILLLFAEIAGSVTGLILNQSEDQKIVALQRIKSLAGWLCLSTLAVGINPNGLAIWKLPFQQVSVSMQIQEWLSPDFHQFSFHPLLWMLFLLIVFAPFAKKPVSWPRLFKVIGFAYLTFVAQRNIALFAIVAAPLLAEGVNDGIQVFWRDKKTTYHQQLGQRMAKTINIILITALGFVATGYLVGLSQPKQIDVHYPLKAVNWIKTNRPAGRLFNSYNWGGYILWKLPEYPVFIDGRADLYGSEIISQWQDVVNARSNALEILNEWKVNLVFLEPTWPAINMLEINDWKIVYQDEMSVILIRK
jgi:hypothetical protein